MTFDSIFDAYYSQFRADADIPSETDDEYTVGMRLANEAINRWANYDGVYWKELFTTLQTNGGGTQTISTGVTDYLAPANFKEAGGYVWLTDANGTVQSRIAIIEPHEVQFKGTQSRYCYFTRGQNYYDTGTISQATTVVTGVGTTFTSDMVGMQIEFDSGQTATITEFTNGTTLTVSPSQTVTSTGYKIVNKGYTLHLNPSPTAEQNGHLINYLYYKEPSLFTTGTSRTEMADPYFVVHRMLASQFRAARNPYYSSAKADAENALRQMQIDNNAGTWSNPWALADNSGTEWGSDRGSGSWNW